MILLVFIYLQPLLTSHVQIYFPQHFPLKTLRLRSSKKLRHHVLNPYEVLGEIVGLHIYIFRLSDRTEAIELHLISSNILVTLSWIKTNCIFFFLQSV
jgi:hypothetical protein